MSEILLYHGSKEEVVYPEIRITRYTKDFSWGFYCTNNYQQAYRWADRRSADGLVNVYRYVENPDLKILRFPEMSDEWLDFIAKCRAGETHPGGGTGHCLTCPAGTVLLKTPYRFFVRRRPPSSRVLHLIGDKTAHGGRRCRSDRPSAYPSAVRAVQLNVTRCPFSRKGADIWTLSSTQSLNG